MAYEHTQRGLLHWLLYGVAAIMVFSGWTSRADAWWIAFLLWGVGVLTAGLGLCFHFLSVREDGAHLSLRYGPVPLFKKRVPYAEIARARAARSKLIDGWGIHWIPGRGWTFNLWGRDCVELDLSGGETLRVGTDDVNGLLAHLSEHVSDPGQET